MVWFDQFWLAIIGPSWQKLDRAGVKLHQVNLTCESREKCVKRMDKTFSDIEEAEENGDVVQDAYTYMYPTEHRYSPQKLYSFKSPIKISRYD